MHNSSIKPRARRLRTAPVIYTKDRLSVHACRDFSADFCPESGARRARRQTTPTNPIAFQAATSGSLGASGHFRRPTPQSNASFLVSIGEDVCPLLGVCRLARPPRSADAAAEDRNRRRGCSSKARPPVDACLCGDRPSDWAGVDSGRVLRIQACELLAAMDANPTELDTLLDLDRQHDALLEQLADLDEKVERVLAEWTRERQTENGAA